MQPVKSILVVVDRSSSATDAVAKAVLLARAAGARVELFMCDAERGYALSQAFVPTGVEQARQACLVDSHRHLEMLKNLANADDVTVTMDAGCESPLYESIVRKVQREHPDLVIKNVSGSLNRFDVTDWQLMRACPATLLLTRGRPWQSPPRFAAAVDASGAESAGLLWDILQSAHNLTVLTGGQLSVLYAESTELPDREREAGTRSLHEHAHKLPALPAAVHVLAGNPEASLPGFAKRHGYDAMLLGALTHRPGVTAQVGTLTSRLVDSLECDFLLVKPQTYHSHVGEIYDRPNPSVSIGG
ncbi:MAG: universal stress protein [Gammaproteobacteria bacterium]|jgi:universal stress protein E|nr:universal stress protein [Gammaproteobacteria bacterium]